MTPLDGYPVRGWAHLSTLATWAGAVVIAVFLALLFEDSAVFEGVLVPQGNDSFYHARRVLDALGPTGFYETDVRLHAPDGRVVPWPWAYDYLLAAIATAVLWFSPASDPLAVLFHVPVVFILINAALFLAAASALRLSLEMRVVAMLCFALSPLTQLLHGFGMLDHHYIEHTFVLLQLWLGLKWFQRPADLRWPSALGAMLGIAPGFHVGLFVLQLAPLVCVFVLWLRGSEPPRAAIVAFAVALLAATLAILAPSETFRAGRFAFGLLSWFHLYAAACTAGTLLFMAWRRSSARSWVALLALAVVLAVPIAGQLGSGAAFLGGGVSRLSEMYEARGVYTQFTRTLGPFSTASLYSWLVLLAPPLLLLNAYMLATTREADRLFYAVAAGLGLLMLLAQFRFHYYGFFALVTGLLVVADDLRRRFRWHRGGVFAAALAGVLVAYQPALRARLFDLPPVGLDPEYARSQPLYLRLATECAADRGVVLANANDGNPILFHTDCSVITNNFIVDQADDEQFRRAGRLYRSRPEEIRRSAPEIRYLLVRTSDFSPAVDGQRKLLTDNPIVMELLLAAEPPPGFKLVQTVYRGTGTGGVDDIYARLYKIEPLDSAASGD